MGKEFKNIPRRSDEEIMNAIESTRGNVSKAARLLGYTRTHLRKRITKSPELSEHLEQVRETNVDYAEDLLWDHIENRQNLQALLEYLKAQGKRRGYGNQSIDMLLDAKVQHGIDDSVLNSLMEKFESELKEEDQDE